MVYNKAKGKAPLHRILDYDPLPSEEEIVKDDRLDFNILLKICPCFFGEPCSPFPASSTSKDVVYGCQYHNDPKMKRKLYEVAGMLAAIFGCFNKEIIVYLWQFKNPMPKKDKEDKEDIEELLGALAVNDLKRELVIKSVETRSTLAIQQSKIITTHSTQQSEVPKSDFLPFDEEPEHSEDSDTASEDDDLAERRVSLAASFARSDSIAIIEVPAAPIPLTDPLPASSLTVLPSVPTILAPLHLTPPVPHKKKSSWKGIKKGFKAAIKRLYKSLVCS